ncbi:putative metal ABC transporter ATP-binding protein [Rickettsiales endosymbiont of Paramecium tredecaurelia]|uniref:metal ABC transporter ATP-binding protein n=1 Tax=Candidatus Sarmatiella mevalonica TaxID=2770581 RepID=UPI001924645C|nr:ATP-binding cassette domain-containing protein [Candidatus Sarmatiella mevalonica]MBL3284363.1 putative metal ABC transporter ATP-binding protein [Candidatus Sarmatiella mevalonica]
MHKDHKHAVFLSAISKSFHKRRVLDNISCILEKGTITNIIGPNGSGKTTLARIIAGLEKIDQGRRYVYTNNIAYAPQKLTMNHHIPMQVECFIKLISGSDGGGMSDKLRDFCGFCEIKGRDVHSLSLGQKQKTLIVANLLKNSNLIILDEPTQSLDLISQELFYELVEELKTKHNKTIIMVSHDLHVVMKKSDKIICMHNHICCQGNPSDIIADPAFLSIAPSMGFYTHKNHEHMH